MLPAFREPIPDILAFHYLFDSWDVAREPLHMDPMVYHAGVIGKSAYPTGTGLGLGYSFAREVLASGAVDGPVGLVPCAYGGSPLRRWEKQPGLADTQIGAEAVLQLPANADAPRGDLYARMLRRTKLALQRPNTVLRGVLWHQGESDCYELADAESCEYSLVRSGYPVDYAINSHAQTTR